MASLTTIVIKGRTYALECRRLNGSLGIVPTVYFGLLNRTVVTAQPAQTHSPPQPVDVAAL